MSPRGFQVVKRTAPIREQVATSIREAIISGYFPPGYRLTETHLCELTGASRTSVREALRQLEAEGFITNEWGKGPHVTRITLSEAIHMYDVREVLECAIVRWFAERADEQQIAQLKSCVDRLKRKARGKTGDFIKVKNQMYKILLQGAGNPVMESMLLSLNARITALRVKSLSEPGRAEVSAAEVERLAAALRVRDARAAEEIMREHVRSAASAALRALRRMEADPAVRDRSAIGVDADGAAQDS